MIDQCFLFNLYLFHFQLRPFRLVILNFFWLLQLFPLNYFPYNLHNLPLVHVCENMNAMGTPLLISQPQVTRYS